MKKEERKSERKEWGKENGDGKVKKEERRIIKEKESWKYKREKMKTEK